MRADISAGAAFPDCELPDHTGKPSGDAGDRTDVHDGPAPGLLHQRGTRRKVGQNQFHAPLAHGANVVHGP
jgi:hypothetical protein